MSVPLAQQVQDAKRMHSQSLVEALERDAELRETCKANGWFLSLIEQIEEDEK